MTEFKVGDRVYLLKKNVLAFVQQINGNSLDVLVEGDRYTKTVNVSEVKPYPVSSESAIAVAAELVEDLSSQEGIRLAELEERINAGLKSFVDIGLALKEIQDSKLYRSTHATFEHYLAERWDMQRGEAYRTISAATVAQNLLPIGNIPTAESQVRLLAALPQEQQQQVWQQALQRSNGVPTAATVAAVMSDQGLKVPKSALSRSGYAEPSRDSDELYTPPDFLESVYGCLGEIDLDPCSNSLEEPNVRAKSHYTKELNGLLPNRIWAGRIYMNPPYSGPYNWVDRLDYEFRNRDAENSICLLPVDPSTGWWKVLSDYPVCLVSKRLHFIGATGSARFASAAFYLGTDLGRFYEHFRVWGEIRQTVEPGMFGE